MGPGAGRLSKASRPGARGDSLALPGGPAPGTGLAVAPIHGRKTHRTDPVSGGLCQNPGCACSQASGSEYCSAPCAKAAIGEIPRAECECGHEACRHESANATGSASGAR